jgi:hypothetical protein
MDEEGHIIEVSSSVARVELPRPEGVLDVGVGG